MNYIRLSEIVANFPEVQQSDALVKRLRAAVREGELVAAELPERFVLPKQFRKKKLGDSYRRDTRELVFEATPLLQKWVEDATESLRGVQRPRKVVITAAAIENGEVDFRELAAQTRAAIQAKFERGHDLVRSRNAARKRKNRKGRVRVG